MSSTAPGKPGISSAPSAWSSASPSSSSGAWAAVGHRSGCSSSTTVSLSLCSSTAGPVCRYRISPCCRQYRQNKMKGRNSQQSSEMPFIPTNKNAPLKSHNFLLSQVCHDTGIKYSGIFGGLGVFWNWTFQSSNKLIGTILMIIDISKDFVEDSELFNFC